MRPLHTLALVLALAGCTTPPGPGPDGSVPEDGRAAGVLVLGGGQLELREIHDGDTLLIARGCQGSQHVWMTLRSEGLDPRGVRIDLSLVRASDEVPVSRGSRCGSRSLPHRRATTPS